MIFISFVKLVAFRGLTAYHSIVLAHFYFRPWITSNLVVQCRSFCGSCRPVFWLPSPRTGGLDGLAQSASWSWLPSRTFRIPSLRISSRRSPTVRSKKKCLDVLLLSSGSNDAGFRVLSQRMSHPTQYIYVRLLALFPKKRILYYVSNEVIK